MKKKILMLFRFFSNKKIRFGYLTKMGLFNSVKDEEFLERKYRIELGKKLDLNHPRTFNEKMQWLKVHQHSEVYSEMVDKCAVKKIVAKKIGEKYVIPLIGGPWEKFEDINFECLPDEFVLKTTHDCGGVIVCKDKKKLDLNKTKKFLNKHMKLNYYFTSREWPYKNVKPQIIAEKYVKDGDNEFLPVYKIMCFNGEPKIIQTIQNDKQPNESIDYFDTEWNLYSFKQNFPNSEIPLARPEKLSEMLNIARKLSEGMPFIRIDLYQINGEIYFSEFTFYSDAGFAKFEPEEWDLTLGGWIRER